MSILRTKKSILRGSVAMPGSKSHTIRSLAIASLAGGTSEILAPLDSADTRAAVDCYRQLGAEIECGSTWRVKGTAGRPEPPDDVIDVANSGTTLRVALGSAALLTEGAAVFTGDHQIRNRPQGPLLKSLNDLGASCLCTRGNDKTPIVVQGLLKGGQTSITSVTSQYLTALLLNTPLAEQDSVIDVTELNEQPYVQITLNYLDEQGITYNNDGMNRFVIQGKQQYRAFQKQIPADFSSATFFFCAGAILDAEIVLPGLDFTDAQGDKAVVDILKAMGAEITTQGDLTTVRRRELKGMEIDMNAIPDALPSLAVVACFAQGQTKLCNVPQARFKETDRIAVMAAELGKLGAKITELADGMIIEPAPLHAASLNGHGDHRVVMSLSLAGMALDGPITIDTAEAIQVTFPGYIKLMQQLGGQLSLADSPK